MLHSNHAYPTQCRPRGRSTSFSKHLDLTRANKIIQYFYVTKTITNNNNNNKKVFNEIGQCLILLYARFGDDFIKYLEGNILPSLQLNPQVISVSIFLLFNCAFYNYLLNFHCITNI